MSEASANQNVRYVRPTDEDDKILENSDNKDRHTIQAEDNTSQLECDKNPNWYATDYNLNQPAYDFSRSYHRGMINIILPKLMRKTPQ